MSKMTLVLMPGDEFAYNEFPEISHYYDDTHHVIGGATRTTDTEEPNKIEVFEDTSRILNVYSIPDIDRLRVLIDDFGGNFVLAYQFATIIKREAHVRMQFQQHANQDIMMRQLVIIGQDPSIFSSRIIIPHVRVVGESYLDILMRTSVTTLARKVVRSVKRVRKDMPKTTAMRMISADQAQDNTEMRASKEKDARAPVDDTVKRRIVQFPFPILAVVESAQRGARHRMMISPSMSVTIDSIDIEPLGKYPHISPFWITQSSDPERKTSWANDDASIFSRVWRENQPLESLPSNHTRINPHVAISQVYDYLRALFRFLFSARPRHTNEVGAQTLQGREFVDRDEVSDTGQHLRVVTLDPKYAHILDILSKLASAAGFVINTTSAASVLMEFLTHGLLRAYLQVVSSLIATNVISDDAQAIERAHIEADEIARHWIIEINARSEAHETRARIDAEFARVYALAQIIIDMVGRAKISAHLARRETIVSANLLSMNPLRIMAPDIGSNVDQSGLGQSSYLGIHESELLSLLSARERTHVLARLDALFRAPQTVKCRHVDVLRTLREVVNASSAKRALDDCNGVFDLTQVTDDYVQLVPCLICGAHICCPHVVNLVRAIARHATYQEERNVLSPYIIKSRDIDTYYCITCGIVFDWNKINDDDRDAVRKSATDKELTDMIFHEIALTSRMIRATKIPDQLIFHRTIVRQIYPFIEILSSRIYVTQTSATDVARAKLRIFIAIYIFADCIVNMDSMGIIFEGFRISPSLQQHDKTVRAIKYAIDKIMSIENVQLGIVPNFTRDMVSENLITAVAQIRRVAHVMPQEQQATDYRSILYLDPVFELLTGAGIDVIIPSTDRRRATTREHDPVALLPSARELRSPSGNSINIYARLFAKKRPTDVNNVIFLAQLRTIYENRIFAYPLATTNKKILDMLAKMTRENASMRARDMSIHARISILMRIAPTKTIIRDGKDALSFPFVRAHLSELYDEHGRAHNWATYVIALANSHDEATREYNQSNGQPLILAPNEYIKDRRCSVCGKTMQEARKTNESAIWSALENRELISDFYKFYQVRCPEGGEHEYAPDQDKCKKCAISRDVSKRASVDGSNEYFDKYVGAFREYIGQPISDGNMLFETIDRASTSASTSASLIDVVRDFISKPWTYNYGTVVTCAESLNIASVRLQSIGAREGLTDDELMSKTYVVRNPTSQDDARILTLRGTIIELLNAYTVLRNVPNHMKIRQRTVAQIVNDLRKSTDMTITQFDQECADLPSWNTILAQVYPDIASASEHDAENIISRILTEFPHNNHEPSEVANYYLEILANLIRALIMHGGLCDMFARAFFASVDARQSTTMKNEFFNVLILEGTKLKDARENKYVDDEIDDDAIADTDYDIDDDERDPFSLDSFDVDDEADIDMKLGRDIGW